MCPLLLLRTLHRREQRLLRGICFDRNRSIRHRRRIGQLPSLLEDRRPMFIVRYRRAIREQSRRHRPNPRRITILIVAEKIRLSLSGGTFSKAWN